MTRAVPKKWPRLLKAMGIDIFVVLAVYFLALNFRYWRTVSEWTPWTLDFLVFAALAVVVHLASNLLFEVYRIVPGSMSLASALRVAGASLTATVILAVATVIWPMLSAHHEYLAPRSVVLGGGIVVIAGLVGWRFLARISDELRHRLRKGGTRVLIVGAGRAADALVREFLRTPQLGVTVVGLVDDDPALHGMCLHGYPILGPTEHVPTIVETKGIDEIIVAIPSATADQLARIHHLCRPAGVPVKILPSLRDLLTGRVSYAQTRQLDVKDLLGRPVIVTDPEGLAHHYCKARILVTGAAGSIGSEVCRQLVRYGPDYLLMVDHNESGLHDLCEELSRKGFRRAQPFLFNILAEDKLEKLVAEQRPTHIFHAAAYKHVPLMELSPDEAVINNILGTKLVATAAGRYGAGWFINISTDKAVQPISVMGATKWAGELLVASLTSHFPATRFVSVRFGNVLGSRGSVVPLFQSQIESGGPVTITHPGMTRYFMLIEEAVQLVLQAAVLADGPPRELGHDAHTFVLDMGNPVPIVEVARRMIEFYADGGRPPVDVVYTGVRPGERLEERLTWPFERIEPTEQPLVWRIFWSETDGQSPPEIDGLFESLDFLVEAARRRAPREELVLLMAHHVPGYAPQGIAEWPWRLDSQQ